MARSTPAPLRQCVRSVDASSLSLTRCPQCRTVVNVNVCASHHSFEEVLQRREPVNEGVVALYLEALSLVRPDDVEVRIACMLLHRSLIA